MSLPMQGKAWPSWLHTLLSLLLLLLLLLAAVPRPSDAAASSLRNCELCSTAEVPPADATARCCPSNEQQRTRPDGVHSVLPGGVLELLGCAASGRPGSAMGGRRSVLGKMMMEVSLLVLLLLLVSSTGTTVVWLYWNVRTCF
jgi:hypothetical protein